MLIFFLVFSFSFLGIKALSQSETLVYQFDIKEEIAEPIWRKTKDAFAEANTLGADVILIHMNTYGGSVLSADSIRTKILQSEIPVYVLIQNNAASAGALISLACDSIFMEPGSTIGAATVVNQEGEQVPDKYQSYMRKKMRATAEENGRNPDIAEAMVDPDKEVEGVSEKGKVVTLTVAEALQLGFCDAELPSTKAVLERCGLASAEVVKQTFSTTDKIISWLINPAVSSVLILLIFGGIYFELQSPGIGFPLAAAAIAAILYFAPLYLEGLAANWEVVLFVVGIGLIVVEIFVIPGFGVAGVSGIALAITGLALSMVGNVGFDFTWVAPTALINSFLIVIISSTLSVTLSIFLAARLFETRLFSKIILQTSESEEMGYNSVSGASKSLIGQEAITATRLMPTGKVDLQDARYDAIAESGFIDVDTSVLVVSSSGPQLIVRKL